VFQKAQPIGTALHMHSWAFSVIFPSWTWFGLGWGHVMADKSFML